jgi:hypothetical protein
MSAASLGVAVRDAAGGNDDFPGAQSNVSLGAAPYSYTSQGRTFPEGSYTVFGFWEDASGTFHNLPSFTMTVSGAEVTELSAGPGYVTAGAQVSGTLEIQARGAMTVASLGIAVRDAAGDNYDFPGDQSNVTLGTAPYAYTSQGRTFPQGSYTVFGFWEDASGTYHNLPSFTMTVGAPVSGAEVGELSAGPGYVTAGSQASGAMTVQAAGSMSAASLGVAVRDAAGGNDDFPGAQSNVSLGTAPYSYTSQGRTFPQGSYTVFGFWEDASGTYHNLPSFTMTVGVPALGISSGPLGMPGNWNLILDSEFSGSSLDTSIWRTGWFGSGVTSPANSLEQDCYSPQNVSFPGDGTMHLKVTAAQSTCGGQTYPYTGAMITTNPYDGRASGGFQYTYGVAEAMVYIPPSSSSTIANWPAVWAGSQNWPTTGEDDIMEGLGGDACFHFHYSSSGSPAQAGSCVPGNLSGWHTFASDWENGSVTYYYDGIQVGQITSGITSAPMFLLIDNTTGSIGGPVTTPADLQVSYLKVWQRP